MTLKRLQWIIWIVLTIMFFFYALEIYPFWDAVNYALHSSIPYATIFYANALWLMPKLYRRKKYFLYFTSVLVMLVVITVARIQSEMYIWFRFIIHKPFEVKLQTYYYGFIIDTLFYIFSIAYRFTLDYFAIKQQQETLLKQHAEAQLDLLKAQVQPHFLFNTLNNIYFVAQRESPLTADLIEKLGAIMRYFLEQGPKEDIPLTTELEFIGNYIELEKMRIRYSVESGIDICGDVSAIRIPPMLLIPLVENVFKHGIDKRATNNYLNIRIEISGQQLHCRVANRIHHDPAQYTQGWGIGLNNLSKRLTILYGDKARLDSEITNDLYISQLTIPL